MSDFVKVIDKYKNVQNVSAAGYMFFYIFATLRIICLSSRILSILSKITF